MRLEDLVRRACETLARKLPTWVITVEEDDPYLARHYIFKKDWIPKKLTRALSKIPSVFVHEFLRGDSDEEYHNHPWYTSYSLILAGGYTEERLQVVDGDWKVVTRTLRPGMINVIRHDDFHRVALLDGKTAWTLFIAGRRTGESWGFLDIATREFIPWQEHVRRRARSMASYTNGVGGYSKSA
jgi:hypothetical protein